MVTFVWIDGQRFTEEMGYWFLLMGRDFYNDTGCTLHAASALRTGWEQEEIFRDRYVPVWEVNGRRVYDYRWWNGVQWARISSAGTVAVPTTSNHEFESTGVGAVDVYDSGDDAGVTSHGSFRANWFHNNSWKYHFDSEGDNFGEEWHKRFLGNLFASRPDWDINNPATTPVPSTPARIEEEEDDMSRNAMVWTYADEAKSGMLVMAFNTDSGWQNVWATGLDAESGAYNNEIRKALNAGETTSYVTRSHWDVLQASNAELRERIDFNIAEVGDHPDVPEPTEPAPKR